MTHPYDAREGTELWETVDRCIRSLEQNSDIEVRTDRRYVVEYLCPQLPERVPVADDRADEPKHGDRSQSTLWRSGGRKDGDP